MLYRSGALAALLAPGLALSLALASAPAHAQAQDLEARRIIQLLKADIQKLQSEVAALQARMNRQEQVVVQTPTGVQFGNADTERLAIVTKSGSVRFDRQTLVINGRLITINGDRFDLNERDSVLIKSDEINLDARVTNIKGDSNMTLKGSKVLGN